MTKSKVIRVLLINLGVISVAIVIMLALKPSYTLSLLQQTEIGMPLDTLNGVIVYYNGPVGNVTGRNLAPDGYNFGLKYQCVEFVKRYYYEYLNHKMPDSWGHAKDFFNKSLPDGARNTQRDLIQFTNGSSQPPEINDLIVMDGTRGNKYGHVAIISQVTENTIEIVQQNPGPGANSRETFPLEFRDDKWHVNHRNVLGWLRK